MCGSAGRSISTRFGQQETTRVTRPRDPLVGAPETASTDFSRQRAIALSTRAKRPSAGMLRS